MLLVILGWLQAEYSERERNERDYEAAEGKSKLGPQLANFCPCKDELYSGARTL